MTTCSFLFIFWCSFFVYDINSHRAIISQEISYLVSFLFYSIDEGQQMAMSHGPQFSLFFFEGKGVSYFFFYQENNLTSHTKSPKKSFEIADEYFKPRSRISHPCL